MKKRTFGFGVAAMLLAALVVGNALAAPDTTPSGPPAVFWVSDPVQPGEVVLVEGGNWGESPQVELSWLRDDNAGQPSERAAGGTQKSATITPLQVTVSSVKFMVPAEWKTGVYSFQVTGGEGTTAPTLVNTPQPWWQQGDWGEEASPGGWLRVFGKCLSLNGKATVALRGQGKTVPLAPSQQDLWSLQVTLPEDLRPGPYETWVHNGCGGEATWRLVGMVQIRVHPPLWKPDIFDARDYGARANDIQDDTATVQAALDAAGQNGGGIVFLPRGRYLFDGTLTVPRYVLLRGEGASLTTLHWRDRAMPLPVLIRGTNSFGVEDLTVLAHNHQGGIASDSRDMPGAGHVFLRRLVMRLNRFEQVSHEEALKRFVPLGTWATPETAAIYVAGENVQVTDCDISCSNGPFYMFARHGLMRNNKFFQGGTSHIVSGENTIFEDNVVTGGPVARGGAETLTRVYFARNRIGSMSLHDAELFTTDGGWREEVKISGEGTEFTLNKDVTWDRARGVGSFHGGALSILRGKGAGQYRFITAYKGREIELERPWDIPPDDDSMIMLNRYERQVLVVGNEFHDGTIVQSYTRGLEWVFAGNKLTRGGGIHNAGRGTNPNWYCQYFDNEILVGSGFRGTWNEQPPGDSHLQVVGDAARGAVFRRNALHNNAHISVAQVVRDVVIDGNTLMDADVGIVVDPRSEGVLLANNRFERVVEPIAGLGPTSFIHPAELYLARLAARDAVPEKVTASAVWRAACQRLETLRQKPAGSAEVAEGIVACQRELIQAATAALPEEQPLRLAQTLTGLQVAEVGASQLAPVLAGAVGGKATVNLRVTLPEWSAPTTVAVGFPPLEGWEAEDPAPVEIKPGGDATLKAGLTVPGGVWGKPTVPLAYRLAGEGWELQGEGSLQLGHGGRVSPDMVTEWMVVGPFQSERPAILGEQVYPPERRLDLKASYPGIEGEVRWQPVKLTTAPAVDFTELYGKPEKGVAFGVAALRVKKPTAVAITTNGGSTYAAGNTYLDGQIIGVSLRYGIRQVSTTLSPGDHVLLCGVALNGETWRLSVQVEVDPAAAPGDVVVLPVEQLSTVELLNPPAAPPPPEGKNLAFADGYDWKLVHQDDFDRNRLGTDWEASEGSTWRLEEGRLLAGGAWEYLTFREKLVPPVRVEADITGHEKRARSWMNAFTLTRRSEVTGRKLWHDVRGWGYMLMLGWHDRQTNELWRGAEEVQVSKEGPFIEPGRPSHVIAQFTPQRMLLVVDGKVSLDWKDPKWMEEQDALSLFSAWSRDGIDNLRIYQAAP